MLGAYPLAQFLAAPILGYFSDTVGRKKILVISIFGTFLSYLLAALAIVNRNLALLFAARIFDGVTGGNISVAQAVITDISDKNGLPKNFGLVDAYLLAFISSRTEEKLQGEVMGITASLRALAQVVSPLAAGAIAATFSLSWTIAVAGIIILGSWVLFFLGKISNLRRSLT